MYIQRFALKGRFVQHHRLLFGVTSVFSALQVPPMPRNVPSRTIARVPLRRSYVVLDFTVDLVLPNLCHARLVTVAVHLTPKSAILERIAQKRVW